MRKKRKGRLLWWLLIIAVLAGLGYYLYEKYEKNISAVAPEDMTGNTNPATPERQKVTVEITKEEAPPEEVAPTEESPCEQNEEAISEFFEYLDQKQYIQRFNRKISTLAQFKEILAKASARPPVPAGEGIDPKIVIQNMYHFFRMLKGKDLFLIGEVIKNEQEALEIPMHIFHKWIMLEEDCPDPEITRPDFDVVYQYAGFFLNTAGGRAYLFRRPLPIRLLTSFYCISIIHHADKVGKNSYGLDIYPVLAPTRDEMARYGDFQFQDDYIDRLNQIENHYIQKRSE